MSSLTHFIGTLLAAAGLIALLTRMQGPLTALHAVSFSIFGGAMILLYAFSTLYHWLPFSGKRLELFRRIDHTMIFVFIAASYTPVCLVTLRGAWGWSILGSIWGLALAGFALKIFWMNAPRRLYTLVYVLMGWVIIIAIWPLIKTMLLPGIAWMVAGGLFYTFGAVIYALKKPDPWPRLFGFHEIFHVFIMLGSFSHFLMVYFYV